LLLALLLAVISGVLVYAGLSRSSDSGSSSAVTIDVVVAQAPIEGGQVLAANMLTIRQLPADAVGENPITSVDSIVGKKALVSIQAGEPVLSAKIIGSGDVASEDAIAFLVEEGMRGMAINVDRVTSAGGLIVPGDHVDIYWVPDDTSIIDNDHQGAFLIAENVEVIAVQQELVVGSTTTSTDDTETTTDATETDVERSRDPNAEQQPDATTFTLLLNPTQAARVFCAESAGRLRLTARGFGDESPTGQQQATCVIRADQGEQTQDQAQ
jgi:pilus assembly protein CpaB